MILLVLFVMLAGLALAAYSTWWLFRVVPRIATALRVSEAKLAACYGLFMLVSFSAYAGWRVECPFCHAGQVNVQGQCRLGALCENYYRLPQWDQWSEEEKRQWTGNPGHYKPVTCPGCRHTGKMSRIAIWID